MERETIQKYREINWDKILRKDLGLRGQLVDAKLVLDRIKSIFDRIIENPITETLSSQANNEIKIQLVNFINFLNTNISNFSDVSQRERKIEEIKNIEWQIINSLGKVLTYYPSTEKQKTDNLDEMIKQSVEPIKKELGHEKIEFEKIKNELSILREGYIEGFTEASSIASELLKNSEQIEQALGSAKEWVSKNKEAIDLIIQKNVTDASKKASEHQTFKQEWVDIWIFRKIPYLKKIRQPSWNGSFMWLVGSFLFGFIILGIIFFYF